MRISDGFVESFGPTLLARVGAEAPGVRLRFAQKPDRDGAHLRDGTIDLETGVVVASTSPELRAQALFRDRFVGVVRTGHALSKGKMTAEFTVSLLWHPRLDADLAHHWLRGGVRDAWAERGTVSETGHRAFCLICRQRCSMVSDDLWFTARRAPDAATRSAGGC